MRVNDGADDGIRTRDLRFTKPLLYQLSYIGARRGEKMASAPMESKPRPALQGGPAVCRVREWATRIVACSS